MVMSVYDEEKKYQKCRCGCTVFTETTMEIENGVVIVTARCTRCGKRNIMKREAGG